MRSHRPSRRPWTAVCASAVVVPTLLSTVVPAVALPPEERLPHTYVVSSEPGVLPEGIAIGTGGRMYVTSDGTGAIYRGTVRRDTLTPMAAPGATERGSSLGVHLDRAGRLYSVGGDRLLVHSPTGELLAQVTAPAGAVGAPRLNDLVITDDWVYVTDFANPVVLRAPRQANGRLGDLVPWLDMRSAWPGFPARYWFLNGIVASPDGSTLLVASNGTEALWRVDTADGHVSQVTIDQPSFGPDGMVLRGSRLYAVVNYGAPHGVYVVDLDQGLTTGSVRHHFAADGTGRPFDLPTTLATYGCRIYVVNSQNDDPPGRPPFTVSTLPDPACA